MLNFYRLLNISRAKAIHNRHRMSRTGPDLSLVGHCKIVRRCNIQQGFYVHSNVIIGNGVKIQNHVSVYNGVTIEDDVFLSPSMVFNHVTNPKALLTGCRIKNRQ